ncbi:MAG: hypothetical protein E6J91_46590 [Deltaproteobacteria bacterium]|nr:MAG: hypothetical protein E6J91_46590 [Deltaproteobacteria bacterium]
MRDFLSVLIVLAAAAGCRGGNGIGESCGGNDDCDSALQCLHQRCVPQCDRAPECGDGYRCEDRMCVAAHGQAGDTCKSEVDCAAGLSCQINGPEVDSVNRLVASCTAENVTRPAGSECGDDGDCRNGTCELGHCVDLCHDTVDCVAGSSCVTIPRVAMNGALFAGCLPSQGTLSWSIPLMSPSSEILLPVPAGASSAELVMTVDDPGQKVGAARVLDPSGYTLFEPCAPAPHASSCTPTQARDQYFANAVRHLPGFGESVLLLPSSPRPGLQQPGAYRVQVASFWSDGQQIGSAVPRVRAVVQIGTGDTLQLHFFFLDLADHACAAMTDGATLDASAAQSAAFFQDRFVSTLRSVFGRIGILVDTTSYDDIPDRPDLDGLDLADVGSLLSLGRYATGINVFFVRSLSPIGVQAFAPNPGPAGVGSTPQSGIVVALDTLCYRGWQDVARMMAHQIARYMGLYHNVEIDVDVHPTWRDPLDDDDGGDPADNLMYFSEHIGTTLSAGQRELLIRSPVLQ